MNKCVAYILMGLLVVGWSLVGQPAFAQEWYPGEGTQKGLMVKYRISNIDYKASEPFTVTIWFGEQDEKGDWIVDVFVEERGKVTVGKFRLSSLALTPLTFETAEELQPYQAPIKDSLAWLGSYATAREQEPLTGSKVWGTIAAIGGGSVTVAPVGTETIQVAGRSWDTYVIGWRFGEDSRVWIADNFPFPIKARVYAISTQQPIPLQYEFELVETAIMDTPPTPPEEQIDLVRPPLTKLTTSAVWKVDLYWDPITIEPGKPTKFGVVIFDQQGKLVGTENYDLKITDSKANVVLDGQFQTKDGQGLHEVTFEQGGRTKVEMVVKKQIGGLEKPIVERAEFEVPVIPEFPVGLAVVMASVVAMVVAVTRFRKLSVPKL